MLHTYAHTHTLHCSHIPCVYTHTTHDLCSLLLSSHSQSLCSHPNTHTHPLFMHTCFNTQLLCTYSHPHIACSPCTHTHTHTQRLCSAHTHTLCAHTHSTHIHTLTFPAYTQVGNNLDIQVAIAPAPHSQLLWLLPGGRPFPFTDTLSMQSVPSDG